MTRAFVARAGILLSWIALSAGPLAAQTPRHIAFEEAIAIALEQSTLLARSRNAAALDRIDVAGAELAFLPDLRLSVSGSRSTTWSAAAGPEPSQESVAGVRAGLSASVTLFDGLANVAELRGARQEEQAGRLDLERDRQTVVFEVLTGYLALIEAGEQVRVRTENLTAQEEQERQVSAMVEGGARPISDLYQQQANVATARLALVEARRAYELSVLDLVQQLQLDPSGSYVFDLPQLPEIDPLRTVPDAAGLLERARAQRVDLEARGDREQVAVERERAARGGAFPAVSLSASYGASYTDALAGELFDQLADERSAAVSLSLSLPLFDRWATRQAVERARIGTNEAQLSRSDLRLEIALQVRRAVLDQLSAREQLSAAQAGEAAARQSLAANQERYAAGAATLSEVSLARSDWVAAASTMVSARYNLLWQERLLDYYVGDLELAGPVL